MSATDLVETALLALIFRGTTWNGFAENDSSSPATSLWISLHTTDPGETGDQTIGEATYGGYERIEIGRDTDWSVSNDAAENAADIAFPAVASAPGNAIRYLGIGTSDTGAGQLLFVLPLDEAIEMEVATQPYFATGSVVVTCD